MKDPDPIRTRGVPAPQVPPAQKRRTKRQAPGDPKYPGVRDSTEASKPEPKKVKLSPNIGTNFAARTGGDPRKEAAKRALAAVRRR